MIEPFLYYYYLFLILSFSTFYKWAQDIVPILKNFTFKMVILLFKIIKYSVWFNILNPLGEIIIPSFIPILKGYKELFI